MTTAHVFFWILGVMTALSGIYDFTSPADVVTLMQRAKLPKNVHYVLGLIKFGGAAGLFWGLSSISMGQAASVGFVAYFLLALYTHRLVRDKAADYVPALLFFSVTVATLIFAFLAR